MVALHSGNVDVALGIAKQAVMDAHHGSGGRARAHAVLAEIAAKAGDERTAAAALDSAWKSVDTEFGASRLDGFQALYELHVGDPSTAQDRLARSIDGLSGPRDAVQRGINTADLALAGSAKFGGNSGHGGPSR